MKQKICLILIMFGLMLALTGADVGSANYDTNQEGDSDGIALFGNVISVGERSLVIETFEPFTISGEGTVSSSESLPGMGNERKITVSIEPGASVVVTDNDLTSLVPGTPVLVGGILNGDELAAHLLADLRLAKPHELTMEEKAKLQASDWIKVEQEEQSTSMEWAEKTSSINPEVRLPLSDFTVPETTTASTDSIEFRGKWGGPTTELHADLDLPAIEICSGLINPCTFVGLSSVEVVIKDVGLRAAAAGYSYNFPFSFEAEANQELIPGQKGYVNLRVQPKAPSSGSSFFGSTYVYGWTKYDAKVKTILGCGFLGLEPCTYTFDGLESGEGLNMGSSTSGAAPMPEEKLIIAPDVCLDYAFGVPKVPILEVFTIGLCQEIRIDGDFFYADLSVDGTIITVNRPFNGKDGQNIPVFPTANPLVLSMNNFIYQPTLNYSWYGSIQTIIGNEWNTPPIKLASEENFPFVPPGKSGPCDVFEIWTTCGDQPTSVVLELPVNSPPIVELSGPENVSEGDTQQTYTFNISDPDGDAVSFVSGYPSCGDAGELVGTPAVGDGQFQCVFPDGPAYPIVAIRVKDEHGTQSEEVSIQVAVHNVPPTAEFNAPANVNEGDDFELSLTSPSDPSAADTAAGFEYAFNRGDGGGYGAWSGTSTATCSTSDNEVRTVMGKIRDKDGGETEYTAKVNVNNVAPVATVDIASQTVQYSDYIAEVTFTATDVAADTMTASTMPDPLPDTLVLTDNGCSVSAGIKTCTWTLAGTIDQPVGDYDITVIVTDDDSGWDAADTSITVLREDADIWLENDNPVSVQVDTPGGDSPPFTLTAYVKETNPDAADYGADPGDIDDAEVSMTLAAVGPGGSYTTVPCTHLGVTGTGYEAVLEVSCDFDNVKVNTYHVQVWVVGDYYTGGPDEDVFVVFDPSLGFTTGGGWFYWPGTGEKTNFGYVMNYNQKGQRVKGSLLLIRHVAPGEKYRLKSNALYGLSLGESTDPAFGWASFSGKCIYQDPTMAEAEGNHEFLVYVEDRGEPGIFDQFWIEVYDKDDLVIPDMAMDRPAADHTETLGGGNIVVPHQGE